MKEFFAGVIKFVVVMSILVAIVYAVVRHWDSIVTALGRLKSALTRKCGCPAEQDDYVDWVE